MTVIQYEFSEEINLEDSKSLEPINSAMTIEGILYELKDIVSNKINTRDWNITGNLHIDSINTLSFYKDIDQVTILGINEENEKFQDITLFENKYTLIQIINMLYLKKKLMETLLTRDDDEYFNYPIVVVNEVNKEINKNGLNTINIVLSLRQIEEIEDSENYIQSVASELSIPKGIIMPLATGEQIERYIKYLIESGIENLV